MSLNNHLFSRVQFMHRFSRLLLAIAMLFFLPGVSFAQNAADALDASSIESHAHTIGTSSIQTDVDQKGFGPASDYYTLHATAFTDNSELADYWKTGSPLLLRCQTNINNTYLAPVLLPSGVLVTGLTVFGQNLGSLYTTWHLIRSCHDPESSDTLVAISTQGNTGDYITGNSPSEPVTIDNFACAYYIAADMANGVVCNNTTRIRKARITYERQISPPPATPTFSDVPTGHPFFAEVEAMVAAGITGGCGGGEYCPNNNLTRGQMAAFLSRALGLQFSP